VLAGETQVIVVSDATTKDVAGTPPIITLVAPPATKFVPVIVSAVPPPMDPDAGVMLVIVMVGILL
jgi:hypothetical protein